MSQEACYKLLKKQKRWMSTKEINKKLKSSSASANLSKMFKYGEVKRKEVKLGTGNMQVIWRI